MYGYIYLTTNLINGRMYIGQHTSLEFDPNYKGSGKLLKTAFCKYGWDNFSVKMLCPCFSQAELDNEEIFLISYFDAVRSKNYYNLQAGGQQGNIRGSKLSKETRIKLSNSHKGLLAGPKNPMYGKKHSASTRRKMSVSRKGLMVGENNPRYGKHLSTEERIHLSNIFKGEGNPFYGRTHTDETKKLISDSRMGSKNPGAGKVWITKDNKNKRVHPSELDVYIKKGWKKGRYVTDETRRKCSERHLRR